MTIGNPTGKVHQLSTRIIAIVGAITSLATVIGAVGTAVVIYKKDFESLPQTIATQNEKIAKLENTISKMDGQSSDAQDWVGVWRGKWNDTWRVEFDIFYTYSNVYLIVYSHEEYTGQPMLHAPDIATAHGNVLTWGDGYTIRKTSSNSAEAVGVFKVGTGVKATLTKQPAL